MDLVRDEGHQGSWLRDGNSMDQRVARRIRAYRDDGRDEVLRMTRSLTDQAGVSHGNQGLQGL